MSQAYSLHPRITTKLLQILQVLNRRVAKERLFRELSKCPFYTYYSYLLEPIDLFHVKVSGEIIHGQVMG
jgi:hypothetical protein